MCTFLYFRFGKHACLEDWFFKHCTISLFLVLTLILKFLDDWRLTTPADSVQSISSQCLYVLIMCMRVPSFHFSLCYCFHCLLYHSRLVHGLWCAFVSHLSYILFKSYFVSFTLFVFLLSIPTFVICSSLFVYTCMCMSFMQIEKNSSFSTVNLWVILNLKNQYSTSWSWCRTRECSIWCS